MYRVTHVVVEKFFIDCYSKLHLSVLFISYTMTELCYINKNFSTTIWDTL